MALTIWINVTRGASQYPLHYVTYVPVYFEVATSNRLGGDAFARNVTDAWIDGRITDRLFVRNFYIYFFFFKKKNTWLNQLMPYDKATKMPHDSLLTNILTLISIGPNYFCFMGFHFYSNLNKPFCKQTVEACTVSLCPTTKRALGLHGLTLAIVQVIGKRNTVGRDKVILAYVIH